MGKFVVTEGKAGTHFNLLAGNGEVIGTSQVYKSASGVAKGIASVRANAPIAAIEDQTAGASEKNPKFEIFQDKKGGFRFRLKAANGVTVLASESYEAKAGAKNGIKSVVKNAPAAKVEKA
ncbi:MAG: YegP family protein [Clostridiales Family XIII bacterium]|nr:YegP family protein [Clostridiales Family XIII bacterium]